MDPKTRVEFFRYIWIWLPDSQTALILADKLQLSLDWAEKVIGFILNAPKTGVKSTGKIPRFLTTEMINVSDSAVGFCRLCGEPVARPKRHWHSECWDAVYPYTSKYWKRIVSKERRKRGKSCESCGLLGRCQADHIKPIALGGASSADNLQFLCKPCHKEKTANDVREIRLSKKIQNSIRSTAADDEGGSNQIQ